MGSLLALLPRLAGVLPQIIRLLPLLLEFIPLIIQVIQKVEEIVGAGNGAYKKGLVTDIIRIAIRIAEKASGKDLIEDEEGLAKSIGDLVDSLVGLLKKSGKL